MSKKRRTRKQKEIASLRHNIPNIHTFEAPVYSIKNVAIKEKEEIVPEVFVKESVFQKDIAYLRHDITLITAAAGIIVAFDVLFFALLARGIIHLPAFGY